MLNTTELREKYKELDNTALLAILNKPSDYRPEAVAIAREELASRNISAEEIGESERILEERKAASWGARQKHVQENIRKKVGEYLEVWNPFVPGISKEEKATRWVAVSYLIYAAYILQTSKMWVYAIYDLFKFPSYAIPALLEPLLLVLSALLFLFRKKAGWILLILCMVIRVTLTLLSMLLYSFNRGNTIFYEETVGPEIYLLALFISLSFIWAAWRPYVRNVYRIKKEQEWKVLIGSLVAAFVYIIVFLI